MRAARPEHGRATYAGCSAPTRTRCWTSCTCRRWSTATTRAASSCRAPSSRWSVRRPGSARPPSRPCTPTARPGWPGSPPTWAPTADRGPGHAPRTRSPRSSATTRRLTAPAGRRTARARPRRWPPWCGDRRPVTSSGPGATSTRASAASPVEWLLAHAPAGRPPTPRRWCCPARSALHLRGGRVHRTAEPTLPELDTSPADAEPRRPGGRRCGGRRRPAGRGAARAVGRRAAQGAAGRRDRRAGAGPRGPGAGRRRAPAGAAGRDRARRRAAGARRRQQRLGRGLAADTGVRRVAGRAGRDPLAGAGPGLAGVDPGARAGRQPGPARPHLRHRSAPTWTAPSRPLVRAAVLADLAALPDGRRVDDRVAVGPAALAGAAPRRPAAGRPGRPGPCAEARDARAGDRRRARRPRPAAGRGRRRRRGGRPPAGCCPSRWTTCCSRPTSRRSRPGRWSPALARSLRLVADVESTGGATVYRFTEATVRRAFDAGWTAGDVTGLLGRHSRTPVPQPLTYLVEDVARRHGRVRVGSAASFVRCDDESTLERAAHRQAGRHPAAAPAGPDGAGVGGAARRDAGPAARDGLRARRRGAGRRRRRPAAGVPADHPAPPAGPAGADPAAARRHRCSTRRCGRSGAATGPGWSVPCAPSRPTADVLAMLTQAAGSGEALWIGYVDAEGRSTQRVVEPVAVEGGYVNAYDHLAARPGRSPSTGSPASPRWTRTPAPEPVRSVGFGDRPTAVLPHRSRGRTSVVEEAPCVSSRYAGTPPARSARSS